jgi:hypothetical protein
MWTGSEEGGPILAETWRAIAEQNLEEEDSNNVNDDKDATTATTLMTSDPVGNSQTYDALNTNTNTQRTVSASTFRTLSPISSRQSLAFPYPVTDQPATPAQVCWWWGW